MCTRCIELEDRIARYLAVGLSIDDDVTKDAVQDCVRELETEKERLHADAVAG